MSSPEIDLISLQCARHDDPCRADPLSLAAQHLRDRRDRRAPQLGDRLRVAARRGPDSIRRIAVLLSVAQMIQYWSGILPIADTTWDQYKQVFLRFQ